MANITGYLIVCGIAASCVIWWWRKMRETAWVYTLYVGFILYLLSFVVFR